MSAETNTISIYIHDLTLRLLAICPHKHAAEHEAWLLLQAVTKKTKAFLLAHNPMLTHEQEKLLNQWINDRVLHYKPLQYILETVQFCNLTLTVRPPVLIPRPETDEWCAALIEKLKPVANQPINILDLCSGNGAIALALAKACPQATVLGLDIEEQAITLANENKRANNITNVEFVISDLYNAILPNTLFDLIVSNPPYITQEEWKHLSPQIRKWEDKKALVGGIDGLDLYKKIISLAPTYLRHNKAFEHHGIPQFVLEIGATQCNAVTKLLNENSFSNIQCIKDLAEKERIVVASFLT